MPPRIWHHLLRLNMQLDPLFMGLNWQSLNKSHRAIFQNCTCCLLLLRHGVPERHLLCLATCWPRPDLNKSSWLGDWLASQYPNATWLARVAEIAHSKSFSKCHQEFGTTLLHLNMQLDPLFMALNGQSLNKSHTPIFQNCTCCLLFLRHGVPERHLLGWPPAGQDKAWKSQVD